MTLGIFARTFVRPTLADVLGAVAAHGLGCIQFNFACCGLPTLPETIEPALLAELRRELAARQIRVAAVSGTFNLIHPDPAIRREGLLRLPVLAAAARELGASMITLCTGTRDPADMWRAHPENSSPAAWRDLRAGIDEALEVTADAGVTFGIEPELANVVNSAARCRQLLDEVRSPRLKVVIDAANLLRVKDLGHQRAVFDEAFTLLGPDIALAHAKELGPNGHPDGRAPGEGILDWDHYLARLRAASFAGALIMHGVDERRVARGIEFLRSRL